MRVTGNLKLKLNLPAENRQDLADRENDLLSSRLDFAIVSIPRSCFN